MKLLRCRLPGTAASQNTSVGKSSGGVTLARAGTFPQVFASPLATDEGFAVKSTMALTLTCSLPTLSFGPSVPGNEQTRPGTQGFFQFSCPTPIPHYKCGEQSWLSPCSTPSHPRPQLPHQASPHETQRDEVR